VSNSDCCSDVSSLYSASQCKNCTVGGYCTGVGLSSPTMCSPGTYNPIVGTSLSSSCQLCEAGFACPLFGMSTMNTPCSPGYYCPPGTVSGNQYPCPAGHYSDATNLVDIGGCSLCEAGYSCDLATTTATMQVCTQGQFCPTGTAIGQQPRCAAGTYSNRTGLKDQSECSPCPPGFYCSGPGATVITGACAPGYFCPQNSTTSTMHPCPGGTFSNRTDIYDASQCIPCSPGYYCASPAKQMLPCPAGSYADVNRTSSPTCTTCPAGSMCTVASKGPVACGVGFYSNSGASSCLNCPPGRYCGSVTTSLLNITNGGGLWSRAGDSAGVCFGGTFCPGNMTRAPDLQR
jgi:hypothetical protein